MPVGHLFEYPGGAVLDFQARKLALNIVPAMHDFLDEQARLHVTQAVEAPGGSLHGPDQVPLDHVRRLEAIDVGMAVGLEVLLGFDLEDDDVWTEPVEAVAGENLAGPWGASGIIFDFDGMELLLL